MSDSSTHPIHKLRAREQACHAFRFPDCEPFLTVLVCDFSIHRPRLCLTPALKPQLSLTVPSNTFTTLQHVHTFTSWHSTVRHHPQLAREHASPDMPHQRSTTVASKQRGERREQMSIHHRWGGCSAHECSCEGGDSPSISRRFIRPCIRLLWGWARRRRPRNRGPLCAHWVERKRGGVDRAQTRWECEGGGRRVHKTTTLRRR